MHTNTTMPGWSSSCSGSCSLTGLNSSSAASSSGCMSAWQTTPSEEHQVPALPTDVIGVLLQYVSPRERLTSCAFVCRAWHEACCSSISSMTLTCSKQWRAHNAFNWLSTHGRNVTTVRMTVAEAAEKLCLDCDLQAWSWLKDLRLTGFNLRQGPPPSAFSQFPPDVAATLARSELVRCKSSTRLGQLTSLTRLELDGCAVPDDLVAVSCLTDLQHLTISVMTHDPTGVSSAPFQALSQLTYLHIGVDVCDVSCAHLSCLASLQELHISKYAAISHMGLSQIGALQQLTCLRIHCASYVIDATNTPGFLQLTGLKLLDVTDSKELNPAVLAPMTGLQHLAIVNTGINPRGVSPSVAVGVPTLLSLLPAMQQLTCLNLTDCLSWPQPPQAYAALTASPRLARLVLKCCHVPGEMAQHMFQEGRVLQQLTQLVLHSNWPMDTTLEDGDVARLVRSCPALKQLDVDLSRQSAANLQPLVQLSALTALSVSDIADEGLAVLAQVVRLRQLDIERAKGLTAAGLRHLTALKGLVQLRAPGSLGALHATHHGRALYLKSRPGPDGVVQPDVWSQLEQLLCENSCGRQRSSSGSGGLCLQLSERSSRDELSEIQRLIMATQHFWN